MSCRSLNFFFWTVWSSDSVSRRNVREHAEPLGVRYRVARTFRRLRSLPWANGPKENQRARRTGAPLRFPAPPRMGMAGHVPLSGSSRSDSGGSVSRRRAVASVARRSLPGSGDWFPARGAQRAVVVLWPPEAPARGTSAGMKNPDRLEERSGFVWMSPANGLFIGFAAMADTEDLDGDHLVSQ